MKHEAELKIEDRLVVGQPKPGQLVLNHGDPAYGRHAGDDPARLAPEEAIFLRIVAYLAFVETVCVPARYVLQGDAMWQAFQLAGMLVREGLLIPERRAEAETSEELAVILGLGEKARRRGEWLDATAREVRIFDSGELANHYRGILLGDLGADGAFRRALRGPAARGARETLPRICEAYESVHDGTPEAFSRTVGSFMPHAEKSARRWAMARYYTTPTDYDNLNTREVPRSAADLLIRGGVLDTAMRPMDTPAPVDAMYHTLTMSIPRQHHISVLADHYCEAVMQVRERIPHARKAFRRVRERAELQGMSSELERVMAEELAHQQRLRPRFTKLVYTLATSLTTSGGSVLLGVPPEVALPAGPVTGVATWLGQDALEGRLDRYRRPWPLAIDSLERRARAPSF